MDKIDCGYISRAPFMKHILDKMHAEQAVWNEKHGTEHKPMSLTPIADLKEG